MQNENKLPQPENEPASDQTLEKLDSAEFEATAQPLVSKNLQTLVKQLEDHFEQ